MNSDRPHNGADDVLRALCWGGEQDAGLVAKALATSLGTVIEAAVLSKLLCLLAAHVTATSPAGLPRRATRFFTSTLRANQYKTALYRAEAITITTAFAAAGVTVAVLDGLAAEFTLYNGTGARQFSDLDLLVTPDRAEHAGAILRDLGYDLSASGSAWTRQLDDVQTPTCVIDLTTRTQHARTSAAVCAVLDRHVVQSVPGHDQVLPVLAPHDAFEHCLARLGAGYSCGDGGPAVPQWALCADALRLHRAVAAVPTAAPVGDPGKQARHGWAVLRDTWTQLPPNPRSTRTPRWKYA